MSRVMVVHKLNNFSGSPNMCRLAIGVFLKMKYDVVLYTATPDGAGFLSNIPGVVNRPFFYKWSPNKLLTLLFYAWSELTVFLQLLVSLKKNDIVYVSTILPASAALAGKLRGCRVICHIHETAVSPPLLHRLLVAITRRCATEVWYVSAYTAAAYAQSITCPSHLVHNTLDDDFFTSAMQMPYAKFDAPFTVLMLCSFKLYKGIEVFVNLAKQLPAIQFMLVLNTTEAEVAAFANAMECPKNCTFLPTNNAPLQLFAKAHVVVNLSLPQLFIETFGLTLLEAMACGRPVIAPQVGGPPEFVKNGVNGYTVDAYELNVVQQKILDMSTDASLYQTLATNARDMAKNYAYNRFSDKINRLMTA